MALVVNGYFERQDTFMVVRLFGLLEQYSRLRLQLSTNLPGFKVSSARNKNLNGVAG